MAQVVEKTSDMTKLSPEALAELENRLRGGYSQEALEAAFNRVKNATNWKYGIDAVIPASELAVVSEAVIYFAGGGLEVAEDRGATLRVTAPGYYSKIGA